MKLLAGKRLSTAAAGVLLAGLFVPATGAAAAQAAGSRLSVEGCSSKTDNRSSDNWTAADWKICLGDYGGANGSADVKCYAGQTIGWNASRCLISGQFEIRKGNEVIKSEPFGLDVPMNGAVTSVPFRFYCQGPGEYTFRTSGVQATLVRVGRDGQLEARPGFQTAHIADATATVTMC
ncbi:hypothetical protein SSPO_001950 [Streptomyces antimycoticus]|uniref:Ricin B lectin domain-containing protein n=1 Tax=Streptomyces antimycoticus TaxID=68175 RepID=A0A499UUC1_9ACTN|nr:hypothetical protein [Streptomyces antimycoticus]BBJ37477.1 hypothetical protein SSPO_001950 [Streptomyces antimycoticus]